MIVDRVGSIVSVVGETCVGVISLISYIISFSFNLSFFIGQLIVKFGVALTSFLLECVYTLQALINVLAEDYFVFISDIWSSVSVLGNIVLNASESVSQTLCCIVSAFLHIVQATEKFAIHSVHTVIDFIGSSFSTLHYCLLVIKNAVVLLGLTSWDLLVFLPRSLIFMKRFLMSCLMSAMADIRDALKSLRRLLYGIFNFVTDVPQESLYGLVACLILVFVLVKYQQSIRPVLARNILYILSQCQRTLITAWTYLEAFTLWLLTNQMTPSLNGARYFAPEIDVPNSDNIPDAEQNENDR